jgi:hypothetical protein
MANILTNEYVQVITSGRCDCIAIWVDYHLNTSCESSIIHCFQDGDFEIHQKILVKFLPQSVIVEPVIHSLLYKVGFKVGDSDFDFDFKIVLNN